MIQTPAKVQIDYRLRYAQLITSFPWTPARGPMELHTAGSRWQSLLPAGFAATVHIIDTIIESPLERALESQLESPLRRVLESPPKKRLGERLRERFWVISVASFGLPVMDALGRWESLSLRKL